MHMKKFKRKKSICQSPPPHSNWVNKPVHAQDTGGGSIRWHLSPMGSHTEMPGWLFQPTWEWISDMTQSLKCTQRVSGSFIPTPAVNIHQFNPCKLPDFILPGAIEGRTDFLSLQFKFIYLFTRTIGKEELSNPRCLQTIKSQQALSIIRFGRHFPPSTQKNPWHLIATSDLSLHTIWFYIGGGEGKRPTTP